MPAPAYLGLKKLVSVETDWRRLFTSVNAFLGLDFGRYWIRVVLLTELFVTSESKYSKEASIIQLVRGLHCLTAPQ